MLTGHESLAFLRARVLEPVRARDVVEGFSMGLMKADSHRPRAMGRGRAYLPGIGPFGEAAAVKLVMSELSVLDPARYGSFQTGVSYPEFPRQKCDICIGEPRRWMWAVEVKLLRLLGDNGKVNDNMLMHILSPYPQHRSAVTDCAKLQGSALAVEPTGVVYDDHHINRCCVVLHGLG